MYNIWIIIDIDIDIDVTLHAFTPKHHISVGDTQQGPCLQLRGREKAVPHQLPRYPHLVLHCRNGNVSSIGEVKLYIYQLDTYIYIYI